MKYLCAALATAVFILVITCCYYIHIHYFTVNVVFYSAIADAVIGSLFTGFLLFFLPYFGIFQNFERILLILIWLLCGYSLAISVPTVIDRSLSFYILEKLQQRGGGIRQEHFEYVFTKEYIKEHRLIDVRLTEQLESGTIVIENECVKLTKKGEHLASLSRYFRKKWLPKERLLMGEYSDDLTDPFRHSQPVFDYTCK